MPNLETFILQNAVSANGNGTSAEVDYFPLHQILEVAETGGGTCTLTVKGSFDGTNWYALGYQVIDATASPARAVTGISVAANTRHVYQILDVYPQVQAVISSVATSPVVTVKLFATS